MSLVPRRVVEVMREEIIYGDIEPAARMVEEDIAQRFGISRSPVREALRRLEADGLLVREERRGVRVSSISRRHLDEVYACRIPMEGLAASEAARQWDIPSMGRLIDAFEELEASFDRQDIRRYFRANVAFTEAVHQAANNTTLGQLLMHIGAQALRYRYMAYSKAPELISHSIDGNRDLLTCLRDRDSQGARAMTERLIERSWMRIREFLPDERGAWVEA